MFVERFIPVEPFRSAPNRKAETTVPKGLFRPIVAIAIPSKP